MCVVSIPKPSRSLARFAVVTDGLHGLSLAEGALQSLNYEEPFNINYLRRNAQLKEKRHFYGYTGV